MLVAGSCDRNMNITTTTLDFGRFTIAAPESWEPVSATGYDSYAGGIRLDDGKEVSFDLGWYSSDLNVDPELHEILWTTIDGRKAKVVRALVAGKGTTGVYFSLEPDESLKFQMSAQKVNPVVQQQLLAAFATLKFRKADELPSNVPSCVGDLVSAIQSEPVRNPPASVWRYTYDGDTVYYIPPYCCDLPSQLFDSNCKFICSPDGGFSGKGDGKCTASLENGVRIWKDPR